MPTPSDAYREGYEKGQINSAGNAAAEITMGMLRDDPDGQFASGYRDGAAGKKFNPPSANNPRRADAELNPFDDKVAIKTVCPNCRETDWFEWKFLGRLTDPVCGNSWYAGSGIYALMQLRAGFQAGRRLSKYMTSGISGEGGWIGKAMGWFIGTLIGIGIRLEFGILIIPIQALVGLFQTKNNRSDIVTRVVALVVTLGGLGIGIYEIRH